MCSLRNLIIVFVIAFAAVRHTDAQWMPNVTVEQEPSLDWRFAAKDADEFALPIHVRNYVQPERTTCEVFVPSRYKPDRPSALVLYLSPGPRAQAGVLWKSTLQRQGVLYASPHDSGNAVPTGQRIRAAISVLHHMRTHYNIDPDRTYIAGFSGGARIALIIAMAYPEYFGGAMPIGSGGSLRQESWLIDRAEARLRVALIVGTSDGFWPEVKHSTTTELKESGVDARLWMPVMGHELPKSSVFLGALRWLEEDLPRRQQLAEKFPASRIADSPTPQEWSRRLMDEAALRTGKPETLRSGVMLMKGIAARWPETAAGKSAAERFVEFDSQADQTWKEEQMALMLRRLIAQARATEAYATGPLQKEFGKVQRPILRQTAIDMWQGVALISSDARVRAEARSRMEKLQSQTPNP